MVKVPLVLNSVAIADVSTVTAIFRQVFIKVMLGTKKLLGVVGKESVAQGERDVAPDTDEAPLVHVPSLKRVVEPIHDYSSRRIHDLGLADVAAIIRWRHFGLFN